MQGDLNIKQVCESLNCSKSTYYKLLSLSNDPLPAYKLGDGPKAEWRTPYDELQAWKERRRVTNLRTEASARVAKTRPVYKPQPYKRWEMVIPEKKKRKEAKQ